MGGILNKRWIIVAAVVTLIVAALVGRMLWTASLPEHEPAELQEHTGETTTESEKEAREMTVGDDLIASVVQEILGDELTVSDLSVEIDESGEIGVTGNMQKSDVAKLLETHNSSMSEAYQAVLDMFPETLPTELKLRMQAVDKTIGITLIGISMGSLEIPDSMLPDDFCDQIENGFQREIQKQLAEVDSVTVKDNTLIVSGT